MGNFYIEFRRGLLHPHMNPGGGEDSWVTPTSLEDWNTKRTSTKLDILVQIVAHHLAQDNAPAVKMNADDQTLEFETLKRVDPDGKQDPDRIVIFSLFPSSHPGITEVLQLYGIKALTNTFTIPYGPPSTTSNCEVGIYRCPKQKTVHFYRLVARGTPDVFLNNITFDKGMLHQAFVGIDSHSLQLFTGNDEDNDPTRTIDSEDEDEETMVVDHPPEPSTREKRGSKKAHTWEAQAPLSPTRPATKRAAPAVPTSPTSSTQPTCPKQKRVK
ncbi:hypothetical protein J3R83DRAFT_1525 [Lanmaoa asiatica]|nr:hypothetical protein J3R83DRAFT_1525 [Lanmaoa asiatica]